MIRKLVIITKERWWQERGFTLLELLIVLMLIGLVTGLVIPKFGSSLAGTHAKTTVNKISAILRYARNLAVTDRKVWEVNFNITENTVTLRLFKSKGNSDDFKGDRKLSKKNNQKVYVLPDAVRIEKAIDLQGEDVDKTFQVIFYPAGNCSGGEILLKGRRKAAYRIRVDFITGLVDVSA